MRMMMNPPFAFAASGSLSMIGLGAACSIAALRTGFPLPSNGPALSNIAALKPVFFPAAASICLFYTFLFAQSASAFTAHKTAKAEAAARGDKGPSLAEVKYGGTHVRKWDRTVGNFLEQSLPFYFGMFLHAILVSPNAAAKAGWLWILFRAYYPIVFGLKFPAIFSSTLPAYGCVLFLWWGVVTSAANL